MELRCYLRAKHTYKPQHVVKQVNFAMWLGVKSKKKFPDVTTKDYSPYQ